MARIDPHAHTLHSDGTDTPEELIVAAKAADLDVVGITDHDTTAGWPEAARAAEKYGVGLIRGVEMSASADGIPVHVLGLLVNPNDAALQKIFQDTVDSRRVRLREMARRLAVDFPDLQWENVLVRAGDAPMGRPHLADEMVSLGYFQTRSEAFETALHPHGPYYVNQYSVPPAEAVRAIRAAGGVPIFAHPRATKRGLPVGEPVIEEMVAAGLFAFERDHRDHGAKDRAEVERLAKRFNLPMTGGSDYHGAGKPNRLGENLLKAYILAEIEEQALTEVIRF